MDASPRATAGLRTAMAYWLFRALVFALGILVLFGTLDEFLSSDASEAPLQLPAAARTALLVGMAIVGVSYVLPNRWGAATWVALARALFMVAAALGLTYISTSIALTPDEFSREHRLVVPLLVVLGAVSAPLLLVIRRREVLRSLRQSTATTR